jgi:hypothetical protein
MGDAAAPPLVDGVGVGVDPFADEPSPAGVCLDASSVVIA